MIWDRLLQQPPPDSEPRVLSHGNGSDADGDDGQPKSIEYMLGGLREGFFVEAGAGDGEIISNTLKFEARVDVV